MIGTAPCAPTRLRPAERLLRRVVAGPLAMEATNPRHEPVMLDQVLAVLAVRPGSVVVDGTVGLGGHSERLAEAAGADGTLVAFDWDEAMLAHAQRRLERLLLRKYWFCEDFRSIPEALEGLGLRADAILLDLGLNSAQVDDPLRGFSFLQEGPLDMRMDRGRGEPASSLLNRLALGEIEDILRDYGDERFARAIARKIVERRKLRPLRTTRDLVECVLEAVPPKARDPRIHPATRTFQAVRCAVTRELEGLEDALVRIGRCLKPEGRMAVLAYHSGEDRCAKRAMRRLAEEGFEELFRKPLLPEPEEVRRNPRSRSAKLRAVRRIGGGVE
ncbi:MAG: 16S rRNA (cytosine(1402)-N(4))-methyltransferase RsmH [Fimbriimonadales bacterium]|nr:16S rRNA (cytosine(1402)-N(4))-methyltransferase RsmH [Fimbriimonadales bacterium]